MKTQLLCTFTNRENIQETLQSIRETYFIVYNYIYVLQNKSNLEELYITFNIDTSKRPEVPLENTILVHRKKENCNKSNFGVRRRPSSATKNFLRASS